MQLLAEDSDPPVPVHASVARIAKRGAEHRATYTLPPVLAGIMPEESSFSRDGIYASLYLPV